MASDVTHSSTLRAAWAQDVLDAADGGGSYGRIGVYDSGDTLLAMFTLEDPSFSRSAAALTLLGVPLETTAVATGTASYAKIMNSSSTDKIVQGTCATSDADFIIDNASIVSGQTVQLASCTYTATE